MQLHIHLTWGNYFSNGPDDVGRWQRPTFKFHIQGTSIGLVRTNYALLSLVDTNWRSTNACVPASDNAVVCTLIEPSNAGVY